LDANELRQKLRAAPWNLHVGPQVAAYIAARLTSPKTAAFAVLANDARTGQPIRKTLKPAEFGGAAEQPLLF
jgi:hypothetical protein